MVVFFILSDYFRWFSATICSTQDEFYGGRMGYAVFCLLLARLPEFIDTFFIVCRFILIDIWIPILFATWRCFASSHFCSFTGTTTHALWWSDGEWLLELPRIRSTFPLQVHLLNCVSRCRSYHLHQCEHTYGHVQVCDCLFSKKKDFRKRYQTKHSIALQLLLRDSSRVETACIGGQVDHILASGPVCGRLLRNGIRLLDALHSRGTSIRKYIEKPAKWNGVPIETIAALRSIIEWTMMPFSEAMRNNGGDIRCDPCHGRFVLVSLHWLLHHKVHRTANIRTQTAIQESELIVQQLFIVQSIVRKKKNVKE